jgi:hypothetical protein
MLRRLRKDSRETSGGEPTTYQDEDGNPTAWTGDDEAPYVKLLNTPGGVPFDVNLIEIAGNAVTVTTPGVLDVFMTNIIPFAVELNAEVDDFIPTSVPVAVGSPTEIHATALGDLWTYDRYLLAGEDLNPQVNALATIPQPTSINTHGLDLARSIPTINTIPLLVAKAAPGNLYDCFVRHEIGVDVFVQFHDTIAPASGVTVPLYGSFRLPTQSNFFLDLSKFPLNFGLFAITIALSSTPNVYTAILAATALTNWTIQARFC